ncbi:MAG: hypothetical protein HRT99_00680 [Mycoplasmatales bacterium]|nr:hypothetical protein [Mycoplasmatales bacterium]
MSIHRFIKEQKKEFKANQYKCHNDGIIWINADGLWQKLHHKEKKDKVEIKISASSPAEVFNLIKNINLMEEY